MNLFLYLYLYMFKPNLPELVAFSTAQSIKPKLVQISECQCAFECERECECECECFDYL